ncbi:MAG: hypothetical protein ABIZ49_00345 [Opitutaceae bacterium]
MGQAKKRRACPAVGREISSAECGENRHSRYACPESCPFNPFALENYSALLEAENQLDAITMKRLVAEVPAARDTLLRAADRASGYAMQAATVWQLFFAPRADGRTFAARWEQAGFPELRNDERVFFRGKMQMRIALLEIQCVRDDRQIDAVDLFDPARPVLRLVDRSMAAHVGRFAVFLTWLYPLPHFWRMSGTGIVVPDFGVHGPKTIVHECVAHLGGPAEPEAMRRWLAEHFVRFDAALVATVHERRRQMFSGLDAQWGAATYELSATLAACRATLKATRDTDEDPLTEKERDEGFVEALVWFEPEKKKPAVASVIAPGGRRVLGRVLLAPDRIRVEAMGAARLGELRQRFETRLGAKVRFSKERRDDLGGRIAAREPTADLALVPPRLLEEVQRLDLSTSRVPEPPPGASLADHQAELMQAHRRAFVDSPVPALNGKTPREAAGDFLLRPRLLELVKSHVRQLDEQNLRSGRRDDINWLLRELGLAEIDFPPPPPRLRPPSEGGDGFDLDDDGDGDADRDWNAVRDPVELDRPPAPVLSGPPFSPDEARRRLDRAIRQFDLAADAMDELAASGSGAIDDLAALTEGHLSELEFSFFVTVLIQAWFALVPLGVRAPVLDYEAMVADYDRSLAHLADGGAQAASAFLAIVDNCRQPALLQALAMGLNHAAENTPKGTKPAPASLPVMLLAAKVTIDALDQALRRP